MSEQATHSAIEKVKHRGRETTTHLASVDDLIVYRNGDGSMVIEFVVWDANNKPLESYRVTACPADAERMRKA